MRILIVSQYFWPENFRINELVMELFARGHEVTVLTGQPNYPSGRTYPEYIQNPRHFSKYGGASIIRVPLVSRGQSKVRLVLNYLSFVISGATVGVWRLRGKNYDVIFCYLVSPMTTALPALLIGRLKRIPVTIWVLDLWPETLAAVGAVRSKSVLRWVGRLIGVIYRGSARIFVQSMAFVPNVLQYGGDANRVSYLPGWAEQVFDPTSVSPTAVPEFAPNDGKMKILFAGNIGEAQDFPSILTAIEALRDRIDVRWIIVGDGRAKAQVVAEVEARGLGDVVSLLGQHPIERMPSFFRAADALLVSLKAGSVFSMTIPGKVQSYLAAGVPILGMLDGEGARVIEEAGAGLVCPAGDGLGLARQVRRLIEMPASERAEMGTRGRAYAAREFNRELVVGKLEQILSELVKNPL
ncbi:glycosyltransferase family 4 protein [Bradyrhizobium sp. KBS0727]|uniref:glycosyltransferase family 4 protein n=1 Tax=unclassified Bradyrhizobium TaxID=2631580 RepID=UPI00110E9ABB|nr:MULTISPECIES: glycosyltransferase family 4 protein [unclassified Bradyrhizobium]QDW39784.1 glycosyltransferase family 4 protein [Bradyrhizobium sp. KBS0725]QDW46387.1 glycosyltransferase family 4 protein [Bradyrhizobium sp. KBS0727]